MTIPHYTTSTGHVLERSLGDVAPETFALLGPLVERAVRDKVAVPIPRSAITVEVRIVEGVPFVTLGTGSWPLSMSVCCFGESQHTESLAVLSGTLQSLEAVISQGDVREPATGPWLYSIVLPVGTAADLRIAGEVVFYVYVCLHRLYGSS